MVWLADKPFEFTVHHNIEVCKRLLWDLRSPSETTRDGTTFVRAIYVILSREGEEIDFKIEKKAGGNIWVESRGSLREGPDATVIVSGDGRIPRFPFLMFVWGFLVMTMFAISVHPIPNLFGIFGLLSLSCAAMILWMMYHRNKLVGMIVDSLTDRRKAKKKS